MKKQDGKSANIIDRRRVASHGLIAIIGVIVGRLLGIAPAVDKDADLVQVVSTALDRGQAYWASRIPGWRDAKVVLFTRSLETPCGIANETTGPFYCPADEHIYLDLTFLRAMSGDLGQAYVIAHELGHHVQYLVGQLNYYGYTVELQADCYAGVWMKNEIVNGHLEPGDIEEAYFEAAQVGDIGSMETWTHGDSEHRVAAVKSGLETGKCDL